MMKVEQAYFFIAAIRAERRVGCIFRALSLFRAAILLDLRTFFTIFRLIGCCSSDTIGVLGTSSTMVRDPSIEILDLSTRRTLEKTTHHLNHQQGHETTKPQSQILKQETSHVLIPTRQHHVKIQRDSTHK